MRSPTERTSRGSGTSTSSRCSPGWSASSPRATARPSSRCAASTRASPSSGSRSSRISRAALDRGLALANPSEELVVPADVHRDARAAQDHRRARPRSAVLGARRVKIRVGHLYPDYLNIYADRGNMAVLARRAAWRGHELEVERDLDRRRASTRRARPPVRRRRPGSRAGARRGRPRRARARPCASRRRAALPSSPCAAATSCSAVRIASATAPSYPASASSLSTRSPASEG